MIDDGDAVAEAVGFVHVVRRDQHGEPAPVLDGGQHLPHGDARNRIEAGGRLVEEEDFRVVHQSARDLQPPPHAAGERLRLRAAPLGEIDGLQQLVDVALRCSAGHAVKLGVDAEVLFDREIDVAGHGLRNHAHAVACVVRSFATSKPLMRRARGDGQQRGHHADQRGLACAVGTQQTEDFALLHGERDVVDRGEVAILLGDVIDHDGVAGRGFGSASWSSAWE